MAHSNSITGPSFAAVNLQALTAAQRGFAIPPSTVEVICVDGAWRVTGPQRIAIHGRDPHREADQQIVALLARDQPPTFVVVVGLAIGFMLDAFERRGWNGTILALEPEPATVAHLLARRDLRPWFSSDRLRILSGPDYTGASDCQKLFGDGATVPPVFVNPVLARLAPEAVERARALIGRMCHEARANAEARRELGGRYLLNTLRNLPAIAADGDVSALFDSGRGVPAVIVAAGPSLEAALPVLHQIQESTLLITVDTALRPLLRAGISPDLVVAVDPSEYNAQHLIDLPPCPKTFLVAEGSLDPFAIAGFHGRTFFFNVSDHQPWPWLRDHGRTVGRLRAWGSVLTTTFDLTQRIGCDPIVFVGADLAYTGARPYTRGVAFEEGWRRRRAWGEPQQEQWNKAIDSQPYVEELDIAGRPARTAPHLLAFRNWLLEQMRQDRSRRFFNATGAGILVGDPIRQIPLTDLDQVVTSTGSAGLIRGRYRPAGTGQMLTAAGALRASDATATPVFEVWEQFAPGISRAHILSALAPLITNAEDAPPTGIEPPPEPSRPFVFVERDWLRTVAADLEVVPMRISPGRMLQAESGARVFRFRTTAARLVAAVLRTAHGAMREHKIPLLRTYDLQQIPTGGYVLFKDELHFRASDDSDPRTNGREYTLLVPAFVAYLEALPLDEVLRHDL